MSIKRKNILALILLSMASLSLVGCSTNDLDKGEDKEYTSIFNQSEIDKSDDFEIKDTEKEENNYEEEIKIQTQEKMKIFDENVKLSYPSSWEKALVNGISFYYIDDLGTNINLVKEYMNEGSEEDYKRASVKTVQEMFNTNTILMSNKTFNGHEGYKLDYKTKVAGKEFRFVQSTIFHDGYAYIFSLGGTPENVEAHYDSVMNVLDTIEFE